MSPPRLITAPLPSSDFTVPIDDAALVVHGDEVGERVAFELLDAERNALALDVDRQHHGFDFLALLVVAHGRFAGSRPRQVGQVDQAVDAAREGRRTRRSR